jgi:hypothetical protein
VPPGTRALLRLSNLSVTNSNSKGQAKVVTKAELDAESFFPCRSAYEIAGKTTPMYGKLHVPRLDSKCTIGTYSDAQAVRNYN